MYALGVSIAASFQCNKFGRIWIAEHQEPAFIFNFRKFRTMNFRNDLIGSLMSFDGAMHISMEIRLQCVFLQTKYKIMALNCFKDISAKVIPHFDGFESNHLLWVAFSHAEAHQFRC